MHYTMLVIDPPTETKSCTDCSKGQQLKCEIKGAKLLDENCEFYEGENVYGKIAFMQNEDDTVQEFDLYKTAEEVKDEFDALKDKGKYKDFMEYGEDKYAPWNEDEDGFGYMCNPNSLYDWCEIGGRWSGLLVDKNGGKHNSLYVKDFSQESLKNLTSYSVFYSATQELINKDTWDIAHEEIYHALPKEIMGTEHNKHYTHELNYQTSKIQLMLKMKEQLALPLQ